MSGREGGWGPAPRALGYAVFAALGLGGSLAAALVAFGMVKDGYPEYIQPFVSWLPESGAACVALLVASAVAIGAAFYFLFARFPRISDAIGRICPQRLSRLMPLRFRRRDVVRAALVIAVLWAPIVVIMFPTGLTADTFNQLYQYQTSAPTYYNIWGTMVNAEFIDHHPVFDTLLYGLFWQAGDALGSQGAGLFALSVLQSIVLAFELGALVCYLDRLRVPYALRLATLAFFAWFPFFAHYAATVLKDTTYLTVFVPWSLMWVEAARTRGAVLRDARFLAAFMVLGGCCAITKKMGVFVLVASLVVLVAVMRGQRARLALAGAATLLAFCVALPAAVYPAIGGVAPGGKQEALGPAIQQVTALLREDEGALSPEEREACSRVFKLKEAQRNYSPFSADGAKGAFRPQATDEDIARFLGVWASLGLAHPFSYLVSTFETSGMLYVPFLKLTYYSGEELDDRAETYAEVNPDFNVNVGQPDALVQLNDYLEFESPESRISDLPGISLFFTEGFYGGWVPFIALVAVLYARSLGRRAGEGGDGADIAAGSESSGGSNNSESSAASDGVATDGADNSDGCGGSNSTDVDGAAPAARGLHLTAIAPLLFCALFLLVSPVASPRYILPQLFCAPLALGCAWYALQCAQEEPV